VSHFSRDNLVRFLGHAYLPLWVAHFSGTAAACAVASNYLDPAVQTSHIGTAPPSPHPDVDARSRPWSARRGFMYQGFLHQYRRSFLAREKALVAAETTRAAPTPSAVHPASARAAVDDLRESLGLLTLSNPTLTKSSKPPLISKSMSLRQTLSPSRWPNASARLFPGAIASATPQPNHSSASRAASDTRTYPPQPTLPVNEIEGSEMQALIFLAVASHALSEALASVQNAMDAMSDRRFSLFETFRWLLVPLQALAKRMQNIVRGDLQAWESRFILTHSLLLSVILALAMFLEPLQEFKSSEVAWVYTSAGLAAQLSAEPTLMIATLRVLATISGSFCGFGVSRALLSFGPTAHVIGLPVLMAVATFVSLLTIHPHYRYASFLFCATIGIVSFCSRATDKCRDKIIATLENSHCFPDWRYAVARMTNVSIGVVLVLVFHLLFWPRYAQTEARQALSKAFINGSRLLSSLHRTYFRYADPSEGSATVDLSATVETHVLDNQEPLFDNIRSEAVMSKCAELTKMTEDLVVRHVSDALLLINTDARSLPQWAPRFIVVSPVLLKLPEHFMALSVSLSEMASILGRRPILSGKYSRSAHLLYVDPMIFEYETMLVSLNNVVSVRLTCPLLSTPGVQFCLCETYDRILFHVSFNSGLSVSFERWKSGDLLRG
jgi:hypothetical protein